MMVETVPNILSFGWMSTEQLSQQIIVLIPWCVDEHL
jgi:hypothetical protein